MLTFICCACSNSAKVDNLAPAVVLNSDLFKPSIDVITEQDIFRLTVEQQRTFLNLYQKKLAKNPLPHKAVSQVLINNLINFTYDSNTFTASNAMSKNSGNCMSLAILTTAFAQQVDVDVNYRVVHALPVFEKRGNIIFSSTHVQSLLYAPVSVGKKNIYYLDRSAVIIDYFANKNNIASKLINKQQFISMYYVNKAAEYYVDKAFDHAFWYAKKGFELDETNIAAMNLLALLHKRKGDVKTAEQLYLAALNKEVTNVNIIDNYATLLKEQGRLLLAKRILQRIDKINDPNPYNWLQKAQRARQEQQYYKAIKHYKKAIKMAPYVSQAYIELHEVYLIQNKRQQAINILKKSLKSLDDTEQQRKHIKLLQQLNSHLEV